MLAFGSTLGCACIWPRMYLAFSPKSVRIRKTDLRRDSDCNVPCHLLIMLAEWVSRSEIILASRQRARIDHVHFAQCCMPVCKTRMCMTNFAMLSARMLGKRCLSCRIPSNAVKLIGNPSNVSKKDEQERAPRRAKSITFAKGIVQLFNPEK